MKIFKKLTVKALSLAVAAVTALSVVVNASAAAITYKWGVDRSHANTDDRYGWVGNGSTKFSVDDKVHTDNSWYSIKLENTDYNLSYVERTFNVEPNTKYKFSAMVKYSGFQLDPNAGKNATGAHIGITFSNVDTGFTTSNEWTLLEYEFTTGTNETTRNLHLQNGRAGGYCKGTAWFSDVRLEKADLTNNWNILAVFFKNADATVSLDGKTVHHIDSLTDSRISEINTYALDQLPSALKEISGNKVTVNSIDRFYIDETLTEKDLAVSGFQDDAETIPHGYNIDAKNSKLIQKVLDKYLSQKNYNQIFVFSPINSIDGGIGGWGGTKYKGVHIASIIKKEGGFKNDTRYPSATLVHEICHGLQNDSRGINSNKTVLYHDLYNYPNMSEYDYQVCFLNDTLPDGKKGVESAAFYRPNGNYTLVDNDMTTGTGITPGSSSVTPPAPTNFRAESVSDTNIKFSWNDTPNVSGYQFVRFKDADHKEMASDPYEYKSGKTSATWGPFTKGKPFYYGIRAVYSQNGTAVYSDWTYLTYTHAGLGVVYGDVDNNGEFNVLDAVAALQMILNNTPIDQHTLDVMGISGRTSINVTDVVNLLNAILNNA